MHGNGDRSRETWLRNAWERKRGVELTLQPGCAVAELAGRITYVATTGAFLRIRATTGGEWHVPLDVVKDYR